jgi:hypothetical protein
MHTLVSRSRRDIRHDASSESLLSSAKPRPSVTSTRRDQGSEGARHLEPQQSIPSTARTGLPFSTRQWKRNERAQLRAAGRYAHCCVFSTGPRHITHSHSGTLTCLPGVPDRHSNSATATLSNHLQLPGNRTRNQSGFLQKKKSIRQPSSENQLAARARW